MGSMPVLALLGMIVFAAASFFFALAETALFALSKWQLRQLAERDPASGGRVARLLSSPPDLLATLVLGNSFANAAMVGIAIFMVLRDAWPFVGTAIVVLVWVLVGCEVLPKTMAVRRPEQWAVRVAWPLEVVQECTRWPRQLAQLAVGRVLKLVLPRALKPVGATDDDYRELVELAHQQGSLAAKEKEIILQILDLDGRTVKEVMRPRAQMACISDELSTEEMIAEARRHKHRRLPIYDETPDTIVGVLNTRELLLNPQIDLVDAIEFPSFVPESMNLLHLLKSLQRQQRGLAIVLDEYGSTSGVVTMEDILEAMVGQIRSEGEPEGFVMERLGAGRWRVNGTTRIDDFRREYPEIGDVPEVETMGGLVMDQLGVVPAVGASVNFRGLRLVVQVGDERRVREVLVELAAAGKGRG